LTLKNKWPPNEGSSRFRLKGRKQGDVAGFLKGRGAVKAPSKGRESKVKGTLIQRPQ